MIEPKTESRSGKYIYETIILDQELFNNLIDNAFFNRTGLERIGSCWAGLGQLLGWSAGFVVALPCRKGQERKRVGRSFARGRFDA